MTPSRLPYDVFICHASEDKEEFVLPLANALRNAGLRVWFDEFSLTLGDSLRRAIDRGLAASSFGVVVFSPAFFQKQWTAYELDGLVQREMSGRKVILPIWHNLGQAELVVHSPSLADRVAAKSSQALPEIVRAISQVVLSSTMPAMPAQPQLNPDPYARFDGDVREFWGQERPVRFDTGPYWFIRVAPSPFIEERFSTLRETLDATRNIVVRIRGWSFPLIDPEERRRGHGNNWIASWNEAFHHREYWRIHQNGHFLTTIGAREVQDTEWQEKLRTHALGHQKDGDGRTYLSFENIAYQIVEAHLLAANMARVWKIDGALIHIELRGAMGTVVSASRDRFMPYFPVVGASNIGRSWSLERDAIADVRKPCIGAIRWFFERLGYLDINDEVHAALYDDAINWPP